MNDLQGRKKDKNQHIQVFVRVRPPNHAEIYGKSSTVVEVAPPRECIVRERPQEKLTKKFTFDRVFGPSSKQLDVYNAVVSPLLEEVLAGYNCTVFAYGQTGTGKTFTMEGQSHDPAIHWQSDTTAGIIPRSLSHLFDELRTLESQEYTVRVSFLEIYNEELFDLLSPNDDASKIRLYEDATKKGAVIIHGLEEVTVHNKNEVYKILEKGSEKRQTAATLMNAHSSRSHTVFSITIHIKENTIDGEELLKTGKLNLVDLAGSENVGRSGAVDRRAREAGNINQSLLTLGRVITALVERAPHIPYRESKLTRLLQESLGGRTKTSIIATVSPASINLEETLSTLDYAYRAKNITNRPEINQKLSKKALLKEYTEEIERLRRDLQATRERNGVYLAQDNYNEMQNTIEFQEKEIEEKINHIKALEETMANKEKLLTELNIHLATTKRQVEITEQEKNEQKHLVEKHVETEMKLLQQAESLLTVADTAISDAEKLHDKINRKRVVEMQNEIVGEEFKKKIAKQFHNIHEDVVRYTQELVQFHSLSRDGMAQQTNNTNSFIVSMQNSTQNIIKDQEIFMDNSLNHFESSYGDYKKWFVEEMNNTTSMTNSEREVLNKIADIFALKISKLVQNKIDENLRIINDETTKNLETLRDNTKNTIESLINNFCDERNLLNNEINVITNNLEHLKKLLVESTIEENEFKILYENYCQKQTQRKNKMIELQNSGLSKCKNIDIQVKKITENQQKIVTFFGDYLSPNMTKISGNLSEQLEKNYEVSRNTIEEGEKLNAELKLALEKNCEKLLCHEHEMEIRTNKYKQQIESDRNKILSLIANNREIISDASKRHEEQTKNYCKQLDNNLSKTDSKFKQQNSNTTHWNKKICENLNETKDEIERFWNEDLKRDTPTGTTPAKKEFSYPRQLVTTSPHERIINRYRQQTINQISTPTILMNEYELETSSIINNESTVLHSPSNMSTINDQEQFFSPAIVNSTLKNNASEIQIIDNEESKNSMENSNHTIIKSASTSDISVIINNDTKTTAITNDLIARSESEIFNKENGDNRLGFIKPLTKQSRIAMKTRSGGSATKRILSSRNE